MAEMTIRRKLVNPGRRKKRNGRTMSRLQKLFFGSKRQRAAAKRKNPHKRRTGITRQSKGGTAGANRYFRTTLDYRGRHNKKRVGKKRNISSIVSMRPNPGAKNRLVIINPRRRKRRNVAKGSGRVISGYGSTVMNKGRKRMVRRKARNTRRRRRNVSYVKRVKRGRYMYSNPRRRRHARKSNPGSYRRKRHVTRHHRRRNPGMGGMLSGTAGRVVGVIGGVALTKLLVGFVPTSFSTGVLGYLATGVIAVAQGKLVGKVSKNSSLGNDFMVGGLAYLAAKILNDFFPSIGAYTGMNGMGLLGGSNFYVPQVNAPGSMGTFLLPGGVSRAIAAGMPVASAAGMHGLGKMRRTGRIM